LLVTDKPFEPKAQAMRQAMQNQRMVLFREDNQANKNADSILKKITSLGPIPQ